MNAGLNDYLMDLYVQGRLYLEMIDIMASSSQYSRLKVAGVDILGMPDDSNVTHVQLNSVTLSSSSYKVDRERKVNLPLIIIN